VKSFIPPSAQSKLRTYRDRHGGEPVILLGNGPSLNDLDASKLKMTAISMHRSWRKMICPYHMILRQPRYWHEINEGVWKPRTVWTLGGNPCWQRDHQHDDTVYVRKRETVMRKGLKGWGEVTLDLMKGTSINNVGLFSIEAAAFMGFNPIHLIGYDLYGGHFNDDEEPSERTRTLQVELFAEAARRIKREAPNLVILNCNLDSMVPGFPLVSLDAAYG
jgi:hypothetical protein